MPPPRILFFNCGRSSRTIASRERAAMSDAAAKIAGVLPVFQTPYHDDESIDYDTLDREIDWLFECAADGVVMAMVSETLRLSTDERRLVAAHVCQLARGSGAVVISVGAESRHTTIGLRGMPPRAARPPSWRFPPSRPRRRPMKCWNIIGQFWRRWRYRSSCRTPAATSGVRCRSRCRPACLISSGRIA